MRAYLRPRRRAHLSCRRAPRSGWAIALLAIGFGYPALVAAAMRVTWQIACLHLGEAPCWYLDDPHQISTATSLAYDATLGLYYGTVLAPISLIVGIAGLVRTRGRPSAAQIYCALALVVLAWALSCCGGLSPDVWLWFKL